MELTIASAAVTLLLVSLAYTVLQRATRNRNGAQTTRFIMGESPMNAFIAKGMTATVAPYSPPWWTNGHLQILLTFLVPQAPIQYTREVLTLQDGGQAALDWATDTNNSLEDDTPIVVILHGLTGCSASMRSLCAEALTHGYRPVVFNKRGHGGMKLTTPTLQAFGCVKDLTEALAHIERSFPNSNALYGIGMSAGSGLLSSYLGETGPKSRLAAGVLISPGYNALDLFALGRIHRVYDFLMTFSLKRLLLEHQDVLHKVVDVPAALRTTRIRDFDAHVYMKLHGYDDLVAYWADNNPARALDRIAKPTLCINALDDPVCTKENIAYDQFERNPISMLLETREGSHCAFFEQQGNGVFSSFSLTSWANTAAVAYLDQVREYQGQQQRNYKAAK